MNNSYLLIFVLLSLVYLGYSQTICKTPDQWEGRYFGFNDVIKEEMSSKLSVDGINKQQRIIQEYKLAGQNSSYDILILFNERVQYVYNLDTKVCQKRSVIGTWDDYGIWPRSKFLKNSNIGSSSVKDGSVPVSVWQYSYLDHYNKPVVYTGAWTVNGCVPVYSTIKTIYEARHSQFFDVTLGIKDPSVFTPRPECLNA